MIVAHFQRWNIVLVLRAMLYLFVKYLKTSGPKYLRCLMFIPLGPMELLFVYVYCMKHLAHVQSYSYSVLWRPWIVETFCDLVADVAQSSVC